MDAMTGRTVLASLFYVGTRTKNSYRDLSKYCQGLNSAEIGKIPMLHAIFQG